ncbi:MULTISPECIES: hypothetical protein [Spirosoma]|uniref:Phage portal protein n=1 Tax=Spirosoma sordidisoli TaxID=2502893 RepID=A0A4Q2UJX8_9BACT|nr:MULTISPECIES: hypothetical protein [Spirosoma]RYC69813.1 hypothetical protein EQG79_14565 [Spirosoma sordidisoli]
MNEHFFPGDAYDVVLLPGAGVSLALENDQPARLIAGASSLPGPGTRPSVVQPDLARFAGSGDIMPWGESNDFPQRITELYNRDPIIPPTLGKVASMLIGRGIKAVLEDIDQNGEELTRPLPAGDPVTAEITAFISNIRFETYLREMAADAAWFFNGFPELLLSKDRKKIVQLHPLNAEEIRWCRMDERGNMPHVYLNANWPHCTVDDGRTVKINALDPYRWDAVDWLRESSFYNCVYPISYPTPGKRFYSLAHHYSLVESGWLDVHLAVPAFKKYLLKNQMSLKYHLKVDKNYWSTLWGNDYTAADNAKKQALKKGWVDKITKMLTNVENAGAMLMTEIEQQLDGKSTKDYVQLVPLTDAMKDGKYIEDNLEAAANIFYALNIDPTLVGFAGGEKMGARSGGSDKREAYLIALQMLAPFRQMLIEPLSFVADYNGWKARFPRLRFCWRDTLLTTLDTGAGTQDRLT